MCLLVEGIGGGNPLCIHIHGIFCAVDGLFLLSLMEGFVLLMECFVLSVECFVLLVESFVLWVQWFVLLAECFVLLMECFVLLVEGIGGGNPCTCNCTPTPAGDPTPVWPDRFLFSYLFNAFDEEHKQHSDHQALSEHLVTSIKFINSTCLEHNLPLFKFNSLSPKRPSLKCIKNLAGWFHVYSISG